MERSLSSERERQRGYSSNSTVQYSSSNVDHHRYEVRVQVLYCRTTDWLVGLSTEMERDEFFHFIQCVL